MKKFFGLKTLIEWISPVLVNPGKGAITLRMSKRFVLFQLLNKLKNRIEEDPYLNFISVLKNYKVLGNILYGTLHEMHRDRNNMYFKNFFIDRELYKLVKNDIEWVYSKTQDKKRIRMTITKRGVIIYDNYKKNNFNVLLMTAHSGTWMRKDIQDKQTIKKEDRLLEEDIDVHKIYSGLVLDRGGIWVDNKASRFECDVNRKREDAIYKNRQEEWLETLWKVPLTDSQKKWLLEGYDEFYFTLSRLIETYRFNIIFDGHSMKSGGGRPEICIGTKFIPKFYMPIVKSMKNQLSRLGYSKISFNKPFFGGYILEWLNSKFPDVFIYFMEVNKDLYMTKNRKKTVEKKLDKLRQNINTIFDIEEEIEEVI